MPCHVTGSCDYVITIRLFTPFKMIYQAIFRAIWSSLTSFIKKAGFWYKKYGLIGTRSYTSLLISIDFVIMDHISQLAKLVSFSCLSWLLKVFFSIIVVVGEVELHVEDLSLFKGLIPIFSLRNNESFAFCLLFLCETNKHLCILLYFANWMS